MNKNISLIILCLCLSSCSSSLKKNRAKISKNPRVIQHEPSVKESGQSYYQFEDQKYYYQFSLNPKEQKAAAATLEKITTNPEQFIEIQYYKSGRQACLKSIKVDDKTFEMSEVTYRCDLYVSEEKIEERYDHVRRPKLKLTNSKIKKFLKQNYKLKPYLPLISIQAVTPGIPVKLLYFMWGNPESKFTDEEKITLLTYSDWYVSVKKNKVFSFSSRDPVLEFPKEDTIESENSIKD